MTTSFLLGFKMQPIKHYIKNRIRSGAIHLLGFLYRNRRWNIHRRIDKSMSISSASTSDFPFINAQIEAGEIIGVFHSYPDINKWLIHEGRYCQFIYSIKLNRMPCNPHSIAQSMVLCAKINSTPIGFVWIKELQGFPMSGWEIYMLSVDEKHQNQGVGNLLIDTALDTIRCINNEFNHVFVRVKKTPHSFKMHSILMKIGFHHVTDITFKDGAVLFGKNFRIG